MARAWIVPGALSLAVGLASAASAQATTTATTASTRISPRAGIEAVGEVIFKDVVISPNLPPVVPSSSAANVTVVGTSGDAISLSVPSVFEAVSADGARTVTIVTTANGDQATISGLQSLLSSGGLLSVDVGGAIRIRPDIVQSGEYSGLLVVVAQYN